MMVPNSIDDSLQYIVIFLGIAHKILRTNYFTFRRECVAKTEPNKYALAFKADKKILRNK